MFTLHTSNKTENLLAHLNKVIELQPLSTPFAREVFLIQSQGMERWLSQRIADAFGVCANVDFLFPGKFYNQIAQAIDPNLDSHFFEREQLIWRLDARLQDLSHADLQPLQSYLHGDQLAIKRFGLAQQLAQVFDQYQLMRPDLLASWQKNHTVTTHPTEIWQRRLWLDLIANTDQPHRGQAWLQVIEHLNQTPADHASPFVLPERISVFGLTTMPPLLLDFLHALARHTQVHVYLMQPCEHYWGDIRSGKQMRVERLQPEQLAQIGEINHPLLSLLGQQGREFQQMILERGELDWEFDSFEVFGDDSSPESSSSALTSLQNSLLNGQLNGKIPVKDDSIQLVSCHNPMRELEVLKDTLLKQLDQDPTLELRDILVMAPDISVYEPFISAVFDNPTASTDTASSQLPFRYAIADRSLRSSNELLDTLINLLNLLSSRFEWHHVLDILERESVYPCFDLEADSLNYIRSWVADTHIRWGRDAEHRAQLQLPALEQNTWHAGLSQMMWGYVKQGTGIEIEGSAAQALGGLDAFVREVLFDYAERTAKPLTVPAWSKLLLNLIDKTFQDNAYNQLTPLREMVQNLAEMPSDASYPLSVIVRWLDLAAGEHKTSQGFLAGQLTFCSMLPMRSIPFKMIAILGLNDGDFPKIDRHPSFDLMGLAGQFRQGDRSARRDDRYQFLDALLSARQSLYLSYIGQSIRTNEELAPSVVLSELLDVLELQPVKHPLHSFSQGYFAQNSQLATYQAKAAKVAQAFAQSQRFQRAPRWWQGAIDQPNKIAQATDAQQPGLLIEELIRFARDPQLYFMQTVIGIRYDEIEQQQTASEPFELNGLENYDLNQRLLEAKLKGDAELQQLVTRIQHTGEWLSGSFGDMKLAEQLSGFDPFVEQIQEILNQIGEAQPAQWLSLDLANGPLQGWLKHHAKGQIHFRYAQLKPKDYLLAWLWHLTADLPTWLIGLDKDKKTVAYQFAPLTETERHAHLVAWVQLYQDALIQPSPLIIEAAWAYVSAKKAEKAEEDARKQISEKIAGRPGNPNQPARPPKPEMALLYQGISADELYNDQFLELTEQLINPIWQALNASNTAEETRHD